MLSHQTSQSSASTALLASLSDPAFRRRLEADPVGVLAEQGVEISASDIPSEICLPSARALAEYSAAGPDTPGNNSGQGNSSGNDDLITPPLFQIFLD